jgi:hypothetical protein
MKESKTSLENILDLEFSIQYQKNGPYFFANYKKFLGRNC